MSKPKAKTKRSRGSAITDAARPAVPAIEAVEHVKVESPVVEPVSAPVATNPPISIPQESWLKIGEYRPRKQSHATGFDIWKGALALAIAILGMLHVKSAGRIDDTVKKTDDNAAHIATNSQDQALAWRQIGTTEKNVAQTWDLSKTTRPYLKTDWAHDKGEIPAK